MRILVDGMPRTKGGIGSLILNIAEYSRLYDSNDNYEFEFIIAGRSGYLSFLKEHGYNYYIAPPVSQLKQYKSFLNDLFKQKKFDYLWFNNTSKVNILLPMIAKRYGIKIISHPHGVEIEEKGTKRIIFNILNIINSKKMFRLIDVPFACSDQAADVYYRGNPTLRSKTKVIRNGINTAQYRYDIDKRRRIRAELSLSDNDVLLGAVGRLTAVKNYPFLINMLPILAPKFRLIIIGEGEDKEQLENLIKEKKIQDRCMLLGTKNNVSEYLSAMDFFLMPSFNEGMPYSIIEAQCSGLTCIVSDTLSKELKITDLVKYISLNDEKQWISEICITGNEHNRDNYEFVINESGYGIGNTYSAFKNALRMD